MLLTPLISPSLHGLSAIAELLVLSHSRVTKLRLKCSIPSEVILMFYRVSMICLGFCKILSDK